MKRLWLFGVVLFSVSVALSVHHAIAQESIGEESLLVSEGTTLGATLPVTVVVKEAEMVRDGNLLKFRLTLKNEAAFEVRARFGTELHRILSGEYVGSTAAYTEGAAETVVLSPMGEVSTTFSITLPDLPSDRYRVFVDVVEDTMTRVVSKKVVGEIEINSANAVDLGGCSFGDVVFSQGVILLPSEKLSDQQSMKCLVRGSLSEVSGMLVVQLRENIFSEGRELGRIPVRFSNEVTSIEWPLASDISPGSYDMIVMPLDTDERIIGIPARARLVISGQGGKIVSFTEPEGDYATGEQFSIEVLTKRFNSDPVVLKVGLSAFGRDCTETLELPVEQDIVSGTLVMTTACKQPMLTLRLIGQDNQVLDSVIKTIMTSHDTEEQADAVTLSAGEFSWWKLLFFVPFVMLIGGLVWRRLHAGSQIVSIIIFGASAFLWGASTAHAGSANFNLFYLCGPSGACPQATGVTYNFDTNKNTYAPGESIGLGFHIGSDDNPQGSLCPYVSIRVGGGAYTGDLIPTCYTQGEFTAGLDFYTEVFTAPMTSGPFQIDFSVGLSGYASPAVKSIPLTVSAPAPPASGSFIATPPCTIAAGQSGCNTNITWSSMNVTSGVLTDCGNAQLGTGLNGGTNVNQVYVPYNSGCYRIHNGSNTGPVLTETTISSSCINGSSWNGSVCQAVTATTASFTSSPSCVIAAGQGGCNVTLSWTASNVSTAVLTNCASEGRAGANDALLTTISNSGAGNFNPVYVPYDRGCYRIHNTSVTGPILAETIAVTSSCAPGTSYTGINHNGYWSIGTCEGGTAPSATITATGPVAYESQNFWQKLISFFTGRDHVAQASGPDRFILVGENAQINWNSSNADTCSISNSIGSVTPNTAGNRRLTGLPQGTHTYTITCERAGFASAVDSVSIVVSPDPRVNGACSSPLVRNSCAAGTLRDDPDTGTEYRWTCLGIGGGTNSPRCSQTIPAGPIDGVCGATHNNCIGSGPYTDDPDTATEYRWTCTGVNGGQPSPQCSEPIAATCVPTWSPYTTSCNAVAGNYGISSEQTYGTANMEMRSCDFASRYLSGCSVPPACLPTSNTSTGWSCAQFAGNWGIPATHTVGTATLAVNSCGAYSYISGCSVPSCTTPLAGSGYQIACSEIAGTYGIPANYTVGMASMYVTECYTIMYGGGCSPTAGSQYTITATSNPGGEIVLGNGLVFVNNVATIWAGTTVYVNFIPQAGYIVDDVKIDGASVPERLVYRFNNLNANHTVTVTFTAQTCDNDGIVDPGEQCDNGTVAAYPNANGTCPASCSPTCTLNACSGQTLNICPETATVAVGGTQQFTAWHSAPGAPFGSCSGVTPRTNVTNFVTNWYTSSWPAFPFPSQSSVTSTGLATGLIATGSATGWGPPFDTYAGSSVVGQWATPTNPNLFDLASINVIAACPQTNTCAMHADEIANTCVGSDYVIANDGCGATERCPGTRSCDYNWKEVSP